jgi:hypothetical protein
MRAAVVADDDTGYAMRFSIMDHTGHTTVELDTRGDAEARKLAQKMLDDLVDAHRTLAVRALGGSDTPGDAGYRVLRPVDGRVDVGSLDPDSEVLGVPQLKGG